MKKLKIVGIVAVLLLLVSLVGTAQAGDKVSAPDEDWSKTFGGTNWDVLRGLFSKLLMAAISLQDGRNRMVLALVMLGL